MNREALDEFFAKAEDVLTDWHPSDDAMVARVPDDGAEDRLAPAGESYYDQGWHSDWLRDRWFRARTRVEWAPILDEASLFQAAQRMGEIFTASMVRIQTQAAASADEINSMRDALLQLAGPTVDRCVEPDPAARALELRRNRNTGPADRRGLDGRFRRNASR